MEMYSTHNEGKSVVAERFIRTVYIDKLDDIINEYNNHRTIKMKPIEVKDNTYITLLKKLMIKILNSKLVVMLE